MHGREEGREVWVWGDDHRGPSAGPGRPGAHQGHRLGIEGKRLLWRALGALAKKDRRLKEFEFATLEGRAQAQRDLLERCRLELASTALGGSG